MAFWVGAGIGLLICAVIGAAIAPGRGYAPAVGFFLCLFLGVFGILLILVVKGSLETPEDHTRRVQQEEWQEQWNEYNAWQQQNAGHPFNGARPPEVKR